MGVQAIFDINDVVRISGLFTVTLVPTDPTTVTLHVTSPDGVETAYTYPASVIKDSVGNYHKDIVITQSGFWYWRWEGTGACQVAEEDFMFVRKQVA